MIQWIISNIWTIIICAVLIGIVAGNCKNCAMHGSCHKPK